MEQVNYSLDNFNGPMDLLFYLVQKNEIDIHDIPIAELTEQYLAYLDLYPGDMESMSEFLLMAATLIEIKSKMLLPKVSSGEEEEGDPREELVNRLIEYKRYKKISELLREKEEIGARYFFKPSDREQFQTHHQPDVSEALGDISLEFLYKLFEEALTRREMKTDRIRAGFNSIGRDMFTIEEKTEYLMTLLFRRQKLHFSAAFSACGTREEKVVTFLALLELIKTKKIRIEQERNFSDIVMYPQTGSEINGV